MKVNERGSTLPLVILAIALLSLGLAYSFRRTGAELRTYSDQQAAVDASVLAQSGISQLVSGMSAPPSTGTLDTVITLSRGTVAIKLRKLRDSTGSTGDVYVVIANATSTRSVAYASNAPLAQHSLAQIIRIAVNPTPTIAVPSAYTSLNGVTHTGHSTYDDGGDRDGHSGDDGEGDDDGHSNFNSTSLPWLATPHGGFTEHGDGESHEGSPQDLGDQTHANAAVGVDWDGMVNHNTVHADYTYSDCSHLPYGASATMPIVIVTGDCSITGNHEFDGTLIVEGNMALHHDGSGDPTLKGITLVGKNLDDDGSPNEYGWVASGLNRLCPTMSQPTRADNMNGDPHFHEDDNQAGNAEKHFVATGSATGSLMVVRNAVADNVPVW